MNSTATQGVMYSKLHNHRLIYENVLKSLDTSVTILEDAKKDFLSYIKNKEISLDSRWRLYKKYSYLLPVKTYGDAFFDYDFIVDNYSRHKLINYVSIIELIQEGCFVALSNQEIASLTEQVLSSGYQGFYFDW